MKQKYTSLQKQWPAWNLKHDQTLAKIIDTFNFRILRMVVSKKYQKVIARLLTLDTYLNNKKR